MIVMIVMIVIPMIMTIMPMIMIMNILMVIVSLSPIFGGWLPQSRIVNSLLFIMELRSTRLVVELKKKKI